MAGTPRDFIDLFRSMNAEKVEYLVVGGYAVSFHGLPKFAEDIDFFVKPTPENAARVLRALEAFGFEGIDLSAEDFESPELLVSLGYPPERVDIVSSVSGVTWEQAWEGRAAGTVGGEEVFFIGKKELIRNKRSTGKAADKEDADGLERLATRAPEDARPPA